MSHGLSYSGLLSGKSGQFSLLSSLMQLSRFDPIFVFPVSQAPVVLSSAETAPVSYTPGRRTGTGSARVSLPGTSRASRVSIIGYQDVSLFSAIRMTGNVPMVQRVLPESPPRSLDEIIKAAKRPVVVFPECTTSNGRGLLRFADVFRKTVPVKEWNVFLMCVR